MIKNYLILAFRNLRKSKVFSAINIVGLSTSIATCLLITLYVSDELGFDRYNDKSDRIYRVNVDLKFGGAEQKFAVSSAPMAFTMREEYPQIENAVRFRNYGPAVVKKGGENIRENRIIFADSTLFSVFTLPMIEGDPVSSLREPHSVVITKTTAEKYFGSAQAVGNVLRFNNKDDYKVTGVIENIPQASHFNFDFFCALSESEESRNAFWPSFNLNTYFLLKKGTAPSTITTAFEQVKKKYLWPQVQQMMKVNPDDFQKSGNYLNFSLTPLLDIHLTSDRISELSANSDKQIVSIFAIIAVFILLLACVNFTNLATARSAERAKEVGIRKVLGSRLGKLIGQFLTESVLMTLLSFLIAIGIAFLLLPLFNQMSGKTLNLSFTAHPWLLPGLCAAAVIIGVLAGIYPAFYLSSFKPVSVLKGSAITGMRSGSLRSALVVFQFTVSIALIIGTIVIYHQLTYIQNKKLGFNKDQVLIIHNTYVLNNRVKTFRDEVSRLSSVSSATVSGYLPVPSGRSDQPFFPEGQIDDKRAVSMQYWAVDHDYINTLGMELARGRNFSKDLPTDSSGLIINEAAAALFGFRDPIGKTISTMNDMGNPNAITNFKVLGVVKNFHFESLRQNIGALCLYLGSSNEAISLRIKTSGIQNSLQAIESVWKKLAPGEPFSYSFLNEDFASMYNSEQRVGKIFVSFAILAILIACLGLFGLAAFAAEKRTKEIGIRKVLGASVTNIVTMLSKDFLKLVIIAALVAFPIAWFAMHKWLQDFAYRINISWWIFLLAGICAVSIAVITISFQAVKAGLADPVKNLRSE